MPGNHARQYFFWITFYSARPFLSGFWVPEGKKKTVTSTEPPVKLKLMEYCHQCNEATLSLSH